MATESLAAMVRQLRNEAGLRQRELAAAAGISRGWVAKIEKGEGHPSRKVALDLARALHVSAEPLLRAAGHLGPREHFSDPGHDPILKAIQYADWMTQSDKRVLVNLYRHCFEPGRHRR
jgi:transcriptional regulator with XRE-family HTH domain